MEGLRLSVSGEMRARDVVDAFSVILLVLM